jgi:hypothetical protein
MAPRWLPLWLVLVSTSFGVQLVPTDDAHTYTAQPKVNFGNANALMLSTSRQVYLRFDLSALPANLTGTNISKAVLRLWPNNVRGTGAFRIHEVTDSWTEDTITAKSPPAIDNAPEVDNIPQGTVKKWISIDVTTLVQDWVNGTRINNGLSLKTDSVGLNLWFDSKENPTTSHQPQIEVVLVSVGPKGEKGDSPTNAELTSLIQPLIPAPIKGDKGDPGTPGMKGDKGDLGDPNPAPGSAIAFSSNSAPLPPNGFTDSQLRTANWHAIVPTGFGNGANISAAGQRLFRVSGTSFTEYDLSTDSWGAVLNTGALNYSTASGCQDGFLYFFGGSFGGSFRKSERFDPSNGTFTPIADAPIDLPSAVSVATNSKLYVVSNNGVLEYDPLTNGFSSKTPIPPPYAGGVFTPSRIAATGGFVYVFVGGSNLLRYQIATNTWDVVYTNSLLGAPVAIDDQTIFIFQDNGSNTLRLSTADNTWSFEAAPPLPINPYFGGAVVNGEIILGLFTGHILRVRADSFKRMYIKD